MFKNYDTKAIRLLDKQAEKIMKLEEKLAYLSDMELKNKTLEFKEKIENNIHLDLLLEEAFAVCREATWRVLGMKQHKVQLMGGIAIHQGRIVEMKTGEGKTLTELCPAYLNALTGKGVHIITVNDYLAQRDMEEMKPLFEFLQLTVGLNIDGVKDKKEQYSKEIIYSTNTELGFDYLKDNIVFYENDKVQRNLNYVIIDEVDSVLIDEARTPLIIAAQSDNPTKIYEVIANVIAKIKQTDFKKDEKDNVIYLTDDGIDKIEKIFDINISNEKNSFINHIISQMLRAYYMLEKDKDYIVSSDEIILIDTNTGRMAEGRRFSDGLHQCLEAKEHLSIKAENKTIASITYQNFFKLYNKVSGMSGTVKTEESEFREFYDLDVVVIPTNKPIKRIDNDDKLFIDNNSKINAIIEDILITNESQRPVLVGTPSIDKSEELSNILASRGIKHNLLNAKTKSEEANIIAKAGKKGAITIATNMAGRGTDIKISEEVNSIGGLRVIGTERTLNRRIDNQLIGRAGRQGNAGSSQFYISCDDELLDIYGDGKLKKKLKKIGFVDGQSISNKIVEKEVVKSQRLINSMNFDIRKETIKYDDVINNNRKLMYEERDVLISEQPILKYVFNMIKDSIFEVAIDSYKKSTGNGKIISKKATYDIFIEDEEFEDFKYEFNEKLKEKLNIKFENWGIIDNVYCLSEIIEVIINKSINLVNKSINELSLLDEKTIRVLLIQSVDSCWIDYINDIEVLKVSVKNQSYNQKQPIDVYRYESGIMFKQMFSDIKQMCISQIFTLIGNEK